MTTPATHRNRNARYDTKEFRALWHSQTPLREIAKKYGVSVSAISQAGKARNFKTKYANKAPRFN